MSSYRFFLFLALFSVSCWVQAGNAAGNVVKLYVLSCPTSASQSECAIAIVKVSNLASSAPLCSTSSGNGVEWAFSLNVIAGRAMFAALLHAQTVKVNVTIIGDNTCGAWPDRERISYILVDYP